MKWRKKSEAALLGQVPSPRSTPTLPVPVGARSQGAHELVGESEHCSDSPLAELRSSPLCRAG